MVYSFRKLGYLDKGEDLNNYAKNILAEERDNILFIPLRRNWGFCTYLGHIIFHERMVGNNSLLNPFYHQPYKLENIFVTIETPYESIDFFSTNLSCTEFLF